MFKSKVSFMLLAIVALTALCSITAQAQTGDKPLFDSIEVDSFNKTIHIVTNGPASNAPEAWAAYTVTVLFALFGLYNYIQKRKVTAKPAVKSYIPKMQNPPAPPSKFSPDYNGILNDYYQRIETLVNEGKSFSNFELNEFRLVYSVQSLDDHALSLFVQKMIDDNYESATNGFDTYSAGYVACLINLVKTLQHPAGKDFVYNADHLNEIVEEAKAATPPERPVAADPEPKEVLKPKRGGYAKRERGPGGKFASKKKDNTWPGYPDGTADGVA